MLEPFTLEGAQVRLEPLTEEHIPLLVEAAALDRSTYQWTYTPDGLEQATDDVHDALFNVMSGAHVAFATVRRGPGPGARDLVVGATRFCRSRAGSGHPGRATNTEANLLMLVHAFEVWEVHLVALQTDSRFSPRSGPS